MGGPSPYSPINIEDDESNGVATSAAGVGFSSSSGVGHANRNQQDNATNEMKRARVLCSYDAKDHTELNLNANEVSLLLSSNASL